MGFAPARVQAIQPWPWTASLPVIWLLVLELQRTYATMLQSPCPFRRKSQVLRYSLRLSEAALSRSRRSRASLGALHIMLLSPHPFRVMVRCCFTHFYTSGVVLPQQAVSRLNGALSQALP